MPLYTHECEAQVPVLFSQWPDLLKPFTTPSGTDMAQVFFAKIKLLWQHVADFDFAAVFAQCSSSYTTQLSSVFAWLSKCAHQPS